MSGVTELTGEPLDEDCLHCYLPPLIDAWMQRHPDISVEQVLIQMAQSLGEVVGSVAPEVSCADRMSVGLLSYIRRSARDIANAKKSS